MARMIIAAFFMVSLASVNANAKCDAQKAARNVAMDATIGVSGRCDAEKLAEDTVDDAKDKVDLDKMHKDRKEGSKEQRKVLDRD